MLLCQCVYTLKQYGHLDSSCPFCFLFCFVNYNRKQLKIKIAAIYNNHLFGEELFIRFTVRVYHESLCVCLFHLFFFFFFFLRGEGVAGSATRHIHANNKQINTNNYINVHPSRNGKI